MNEHVKGLIEKGDELYEAYSDPYSPSARFFKAEQLMKMWPEIRYWLANNESR
jgi:hypothetical protein